ncbi:MAG: endonuclease [Thermoplasmata archaeon]|nr:endonuclease [Thermoplasmata archaeon]
METRDRLSNMLEEIAREKMDVSSEKNKLVEIAKKHGFEHIRTEKDSSFIVRDNENKKYFLVDSNREFKEIEKP